MDHPVKLKNRKGFTLLEVIAVIAVLAILASIAVPGFSAWLPNARLKSAARDLYSNMQLTKIEAVKSNTDYTLEFDSGAGTYKMVDGSGTVRKTVTLSDYGSGVRFGSSAATSVDASPMVSDFVSYADDDSDGYKEGAFNSRGTGEDGYVYITNDKGTSYAVGSRLSGAIVLLKWDGANWK